MKKLLSVCLTAIMAGSILTGCSSIKEAFVKANGVIVYGDQQQIENAYKIEEKSIVEKEQYKVKLAEADGQKILILNENTANVLVEKGLLKEVKDNSKTEPITTLPEVKQGKGVLFAKENTNNINIDGQQVEVTYEGNKIIGDGRSYADMFLIVDDADFSTLKGTDKTMGIIEYDNDPSEKLVEFDVEEVQLVKIGE